MSLQGQIVFEHRQWLKGFDNQHLKDWDDEYSVVPESALCEASVRDVMQGFGYFVEPWADLIGTSGKGAEKRPDFRCSKNSSAFYVEVANISIEKATEHTGLSHPETPGASGYDILAKAIFAKTQKKNTQCKQDLPTLLAVGTFHTAASVLAMDEHCAEYLLTGEQLITWKVNPATGKSFGPTYLSTQFRNAAFLRPGDYSIAHARTSISGILLCGFGRFSASILGLLHPNADRAFDPALLPRIPFAGLHVDIFAGKLAVCWSNDLQVALRSFPLASREEHPSGLPMNIKIHWHGPFSFVDGATPPYLFDPKRQRVQ